MTRRDGIFALALMALVACLVAQCDAARTAEGEKQHALQAARDSVKAADIQAGLWQARYAEAVLSVRTVTDTVRRTITRVDSFVVEHPVDSSGWDSATVAEYETEVSHAMRSCRLLMGAARQLQTSCDSALVAKDSQIAKRDFLIVGLERQKPSFIQRHWRAVGVLSFLGGAYLTARVVR